MTFILPKNYFTEKSQGTPEAFSSTGGGTCEKTLFFNCSFKVNISHKCRSDFYCSSLRLG